MNKNIVSLLLLIVCTCALVFAFPAIKENEISKDVCKLPMVKGNCRALMRRWKYDMEAKDCVVFIYGGCSGNENNFMSKKDCMEVCRGV